MPRQAKRSYTYNQFFFLFFSKYSYCKRTDRELEYHRLWWFACRLWFDLQTYLTIIYLEI